MVQSLVLCSCCFFIKFVKIFNWKKKFLKSVTLSKNYSDLDIFICKRFELEIWNLDQQYQFIITKFQLCVNFNHSIVFHITIWILHFSSRLSKTRRHAKSNPFFYNGVQTLFQYQNKFYTCFRSLYIAESTE